MNTTTRRHFLAQSIALPTAPRDPKLPAAPSSTLAIELGRKLEWNPETEAFANDCEAYNMCNREPRDWAKVA